MVLEEWKSTLSQFHPPEILLMECRYILPGEQGTTEAETEAELCQVCRQLGGRGGDSRVWGGVGRVWGGDSRV